MTRSYSGGWSQFGHFWPTMGRFWAPLGRQKGAKGCAEVGGRSWGGPRSAHLMPPWPRVGHRNRFDGWGEGVPFPPGAPSTIEITSVDAPRGGTTEITFAAAPLPPTIQGHQGASGV